MRILHLIDSGGLYGAEIMLVSLAAQQREMGLEVVIGSIRRPDLPEKPLERAARLRGLIVEPFTMKPGLNLAGAWRILRYARANGIDVLHSHGYKTNILLGLMPKTLRRLPLVTTLHGWTHTGGWTKMRLNELLDSLALRFVDRIVLVNQGMLDRLDVRRLPQKKTRVINNGIDLLDCDDRSGPSGAADSPEERIRTFCREGTILLSIGRLSVEKGYDYLLDAVAALRTQHHRDVRLLLIGDGYLRDKLRNRVQDLGLGNAVMFTGYLDDARRYIPYADIYVISSLTEGLPMTLLETMASGVPIIATAVGGIPHVVSDREECLLVYPEDSRAISAAVLEVINNPEETEARTRAAQRKVRSGFTVATMTDQYGELYRELV